jgi:hypothetical protein
MSILRLVDSQHQILAQVVSQPLDSISLEFLIPEDETDLRDALTAFIDYSKHYGLPLRVSRQVQVMDCTIYVDDEVLINPHDERFLQALGNTISCYTFGNQGKRVFALMCKQ